MALKGLTALFGGSGAPIEFSNKNYKKNNKLYTIVTYLIAIVIVGLMMVFGRNNPSKTTESSEVESTMPVEPSIEQVVETTQPTSNRNVLTSLPVYGAETVSSSGVEVNGTLSYEDQEAWVTGSTEATSDPNFNISDEELVSPTYIQIDIDTGYEFLDIIDECEDIDIDNLYSTVVINDNIPSVELNISSYEDYSSDDLGRAIFAQAIISSDMTPDSDRPEEITVDPAGWHSIPAEDVENGWLYNRCHLIAYCLTAETDNLDNLVTGTRNLNVECMLPYEIEVAEALDDNTDLHVFYRATPIYSGDNLLPNGILLEAYSLEDYGETVCFCVFCPNTQPGWDINYRTGTATHNG